MACLVDAVRAGGLDELIDRQRGVLGLDLDESLGDLGGHAPGLAAVGAALRVQRLEPAGAVHAQPIAHRLRGDPGAPGAGDGVGALGLLAQPLADPRGAGREMDQVGDEAVAEMLRATFPLICCGGRYVAVIQFPFVL